MTRAHFAFLVLTACDPTVYGGLEDQASTRVAEAPDSYPRGGFGAVLAAFQGDRGSIPISALVVSAGTASPVAIYDVWDGHDIVLSGPRDDDCTDTGECDDGAGSALAGIPMWRRGMLGEGRLCTIIAASTAESVLVQCESTTLVDRFVVGGGRAFGAAMVSVAGATSTHALAVIGAPAIGPIDAGRLYRLPDGAAPVEIALPAGVSPAGGHLGAELAAYAIDAQHVFVAGAAIDGNRVVVAEVFDEGAGVQSDVIACIDDPAGGFGGSLLFADLTNDGVPELVVGSTADATGRLETVRVYPGTGRPGRGTCGPWAAAPAELACPSVQGVDCAASGFGGDLAAGDLDGDSNLELLVGAPFATVEGVSRAGTVFVFRGSASGPDVATTRALRFSSPEADDRLGTTVAAAGSLLSSATPRHEPIASAPGRDAFAAFLCSGLPGDEPAIGERCLPM
jgi:hypothetical protein